MNMQIGMNQQARETIRRKVLEKAIEMFPELTGAKTWLGYRIEKEIQKTRTQTIGFWHPKNIEVPFTKTVTCIKTECVLSSVLNIESEAPEYDDVAIWIGGQLEKLYAQVNIAVCNPEKLGLAIGWRCAYCNSTNKAEDSRCSHCAAPRGW